MRTQIQTEKCYRPLLPYCCSFADEIRRIKRLHLEIKGKQLSNCLEICAGVKRDTAQAINKIFGYISDERITKPAEPESRQKRDN